MTDRQPLVTVICLCYNQAPFVKEAITSALNQTYSNVELIVVDDASNDESKEVIKKFIINKPEILFISNTNNLGNCAAFNKALKKAKGEYIIDLAADDVLLPLRIEEGIKAFQQKDDKYGVNFSDAEIISEEGEHIKFHYNRNVTGKLLENIPQGDVFEIILTRYFICPPTIMVKREVYEQLSGYDESLNYEDFDFWVRSSRNWKYCYTDKILVKKREVKNSHGKNQYKRKSKQMYSTYVVCKKAYSLCQNKKEHEALRMRIQYELKHSLWTRNFVLAFRYIHLWIKSI